MLHNQEDITENKPIHNYSTDNVAQQGFNLSHIFGTNTLKAPFYKDVPF